MLLVQQIHQIFAVSMSINNAPTPSFSDTSANLNTNGVRLGNTLTTISFSDDESDTLDHSTFVFTDPSGKLVKVEKIILML